MAEVTAITQSLKALQELVTEGVIPINATVTIFTDSQSSLKALASPYIHTQTIKTCLHALRSAQTHHQIKLVWIKAHTGQEGNEIADKLAKLGASQPRPVHGPGPFDTVPLSFVRKIAKQTALDKWQENWTTKQKARQTKIICPTINLSKGKQAANLDRKDAGLYIRWVTGHNFLNYHKSLINKGETNPTCRLCGEEVESSSHLLFQCPTLIPQRQHFLGYNENLDPTKIPVKTLLKFITFLSNIMETPDDEIKDTDHPHNEEND
jgi:ribonuclease HI